QDDEHGVEIADVFWKGRVEWRVQAYGVLHHGFLQPRAPGLCGESVENELRVLSVDLALGSNQARQQFGRIASACAQLRHPVAALNAEEPQELRRLSLFVELLVRFAAVGSRHCGRYRIARHGFARGRSDMIFDDIRSWFGRCWCGRVPGPWSQYSPSPP